MIMMMMMMFDALFSEVYDVR